MDAHAGTKKSCLVGCSIIRCEYLECQEVNDRNVFNLLQFIEQDFTILILMLNFDLRI